MTVTPLRILILTLSVFLTACQNNAEKPQTTVTPAAAPESASAKRTILFFGNSLTAAYQLSLEQGFPAIIQQKIDALQLPYVCVNAGVSGETTADGVNRVDWVLSQPVDVFVLELGGNDVLRGLPLDQTRRNLQTIVDKVKSKYPQCKIVIAGMMAPPNLGAQYANQFKAIYPDLARANQAALIPFLLDGVGGDPALNLADGIHPNIEGQKIVAEHVWKVLQGLL